jgi:16S rRNA processing protein RimM
MSAEFKPARVLMGRIGRPHGVRGLAHLVSDTTPPEAIFGYALTDEQGRAVKLVRAAGGGEGLLARIDGVADRDAAAAWTNRVLYADRAALPAPAAEEFYHADLLLLRAEDASGRALGRVAEIHDHGAGVALEIVAEGAAPLIVPFTRAAVPVVDIAGGRIVVDPPPELVVEPRAERGEASSAEAAE